jgi:hypothetical protein
MFNFCCLCFRTGRLSAFQGHDNPRFSQRNINTAAAGTTGKATKAGAPPLIVHQPTVPDATRYLVTYTRAMQRNLIKGLATYNILQNPKYKEAFGITWKFAADHDKVRSVRKLKVRANDLVTLMVLFYDYYLFLF